MSEAPVSGRKIVKAFGWFFATLTMVALLSPPGATHDEWYHASSIWCGQGIRSPYCTEKIDSQRVAITNLDAANCQASAASVLYCPTPRTGQSNPVTNYDLYPTLFYFVLSWFVVPSPDLSIAVVRVVSALIITVVLGLAMWLLPRRHQTVLLLVALTTFPATGFFLFGSINPSAWTAVGVGVGWLSLHAAAVSTHITRRRRVGISVVGIVACIMAVGSRYDAYPFLAVAIGLICLHVARSRFRRNRKLMLLAASTLALALLVTLEMFTPLSPFFHLRRLFEFSNGQPDNITFLSHNLVEGLPNAFLALGTVPTMSQVVLPEIVYLIGVSTVVFFVIRTFERRNILQLIGSIVVSLAIAVSIAAQVAFNDNRNQGFIEPRYVYPLFILLVSWWYALGPDDLHGRVSRHLKPAAFATTFAFFLTVFTIAERFVDRQTFGLRYLPEGPDQWWWTWLPIGPNVLVVLAPCCLWMFFRQFMSDEVQSTNNVVKQ